MPSNSAILAICLKAAREVAEEVARKVIPKAGPRGPKGADGQNGRDGRNGVDGRDGIDGKDGVNGRDGKDGKPGKDGATWHLLFEEPDEDCGKNGDFVLDGKASTIYYKFGGQWDFIAYLKAEVPQWQMQPPRAWSPEQIREIANVAVQAAESYHLIDEDSDNAVKYYGFGKDDDQGHYIERVDTSASPIAYRVAVPVADYATDWGNRASLTYARRTEVDLP